MTVRDREGTLDASRASEAPRDATPAGAGRLAGRWLRGALGSGAGQIAAWSILALVAALAIEIRTPPLQGGWRVRRWVHVFEAGNLLGLGLVCAGAVLAWRRLRRPALLVDLLALEVAALAVGFATLADDLSGPAARLDGAVSARAWIILLAAGVSVGIPAAAVVGRALRRGRLRAVALAIGVAAGIANAIGMPESYPGGHFFVAWGAAVFMGSALTGAAVPVPAWRGWIWTRAGLLVAAAALAAGSYLIRPSNAVLVDLLRMPGSVSSPFLARANARSSELGPIPLALTPWFMDRSGESALPPSTRPLLGAPIVILLTIDSVRADVFADDRYRRELPELTRLREESLHFTQARAPGPATTVTLTSLFAGTYYSQQYWTNKTADGATGLYPHEDTSVRFPELLAANGAATVNFAAQYWLRGSYGIARGFSEETLVGKSRRYPAASKLVDPAIQRIEEHKGGPLFLFIHFLDPHSPYNSAGPRPTPFDGYIAEIGLVDEQIARLRVALEARQFDRRTCLIVTSDHGEAFGEHGLTWHAKSLYDELVHVPLIISAPGVAARRIDDRVSLIDLGPTILDLFGVSTPGHYMGQSLTGYLRGESPTLDRPIVAEGRLKRSLITPEGYKVIHDTRTGSRETYDLIGDPGETKNLFGEERADGARGHTSLDAFFRAHTLRRDGYVVPYRH